MQLHRTLQLELGSDTSAPQNAVNMCYFMQPYTNFDIHGNPLVLFFDRYGITMINLKSQEVHLILSYEDQAHYYRKPPDPKATLKKDIQDKIKTANIDMW